MPLLETEPLKKKKKREEKKKRRPCSSFAHPFSLDLFPPKRLPPPLFQYSEKYYDDIYEYRCVFWNSKEPHKGLSKGAEGKKKQWLSSFLFSSDDARSSPTTNRDVLFDSRLLPLSSSSSSPCSPSFLFQARRAPAGHRAAPPQGKAAERGEDLGDLEGAEVESSFFSSSSSCPCFALRPQREEGGGRRGGDLGKMIFSFTRRFCLVTSSTPPAKGGRVSQESPALLCTRIGGRSHEERWHPRRWKTIREGAAGIKSRRFFFPVETSRPRPRPFFLSHTRSLSLAQKTKTGRVAGHRRAAVPRLGPLRHPQAGAAREFVSFEILNLFCRLSFFGVSTRRRAVAGLNSKKKTSFLFSLSFPPSENRSCSSAAPRTTRPRSSRWPRRTTRKTSRLSSSRVQRENKQTTTFFDRKNTKKRTKKSPRHFYPFPRDRAPLLHLILPCAPFLPRTYLLTKAEKSGEGQKKGRETPFLLLASPSPSFPFSSPL